MKRFLATFLGSLAALLVVALTIAGVGGLMAGRGVDVEDDSYLVIGFTDALPEYDPPGGILAQIGGDDVESLQRILTNLDKARVDPRIKGVIFRVAFTGDLPSAAIQEIHAAVDRLRAADKKVYAWAESMTTQHYFLLAACDEVFVPPTAFVVFTGFDTEVMYFKRMLDKLGIEADLHRIKDYKSAAEPFLRDNMSEPARQNKQWLADERWQIFVDTVKKRRGLTEERVVALMERGVLRAQEAREGGLIDAVMYWDELEVKLGGNVNNAEEALPLISSRQYAEVEPEDLDLEGDRTIAVIHAQGMIFGRKNDVHPLFGVLMGHESIIAELRRARLDEDVAAIVFRVDSRGGDGTASDLIARELRITNEVKPVVVSMANVAASGGYVISYKARKIVADPLTVTGSIGSITGKVSMKGLYDKLGLTHAHVTKGPNALMFSDQRMFTPDERKRIADDHWAAFHEWVSDIAKHRSMTVEGVEKLAHGRVWTGRQAVANGLVDEVGDLNHAIELAKSFAAIPAEEQVTVAHFPKTKSLLEQVLGGDESVAVAAKWLSHRALKRQIDTTLEILASHPQLVAEVD